jgi:uncharacterized protein (TIGR02996 family)
MNDRESFLQAIRANPDDDHLRLIYADWLEERGDPRGEFIRVQIELQDRDLSPRRRIDLLVRENELLEAHRVEWLRPLGDLQETGQFMRGFLWKVVLDPRSFLDRAGEMFAWETIEALVLRGVGTEIDRILSSAHLLKVRCLWLTREGLDDVAVTKLADSANCQSLKGLFLEANHFGIPGARAIAASGHLAQLVLLNCSYNPIEDLGLQALASSARLRKLRDLSLSHCGIGPSGIRALGRSVLLEQLRELHLGNNPLGNEGVRALTRAPGLASLTVLDLQGTLMDSIGVQALAGSRYAENLQRLNLCNNPISEAGVRALADSPYLTELRELRLPSQQLNNASIDVLRKRFGTKVSLDPVVL